MKTISLAVFLVLISTVGVHAQSQKETITKSSGFRTPNGVHVLSVENIQGSVTVEAYKGDKVMLEAEKTISAKDQQKVSLGMQEVQLKMEESGDSVYVYLEAPFIYRKKGKTRHFRMDREEADYEFDFNLTLKVPANTNLIVSTVNNGQVVVKNVTGNIKARNVNGGIALTGITGTTDATTVNGNIEVAYASNPPEACHYKTINGDIKVSYAAKLDATVSFKTMNGQFYTDLPDLELLPVKVSRNSSNLGAGTVYKVDKNQRYKAGQGTVPLRFETLNGNIYLRKK